MWVEEDSVYAILQKDCPRIHKVPSGGDAFENGIKSQHLSRLLASDFIEEQGDRGKWKGNGQTALRVVFQPQHKASSGNYRITFI